MGVNDTIYDTIGKHWKTGAVIQVGKYKMRRSLVEPTIGLEPMTCRLRNDGRAPLSYCKTTT